MRKEMQTSIYFLDNTIYIHYTPICSIIVFFWKIRTRNHVGRPTDAMQGALQIPCGGSPRYFVGGPTDSMQGVLQISYNRFYRYSGEKLRDTTQRGPPSTLQGVLQTHCRGSYRLHAAGPTDIMQKVLQILCRSFRYHVKGHSDTMQVILQITCRVSRRYLRQILCGGSYRYDVGHNLDGPRVFMQRVLWITYRMSYK